MKKVLLGTSALALLGATSAANAAEFDVKVGGYFEAYLAYASSDINGFTGDDFDGVDIKQDAEINFKPSITLDNGLKIGADIQLEGNTSGDQIDESFLFIRGSFGEILLGNENSAGYKMTYAAPDVTFLGVNSGSLGNFVPFSGGVSNDNNGDGDTADAGENVNVGDDVFRGTLGSTFLENARNNDAARITYFTPRFAGFQLGLSYARDGLDDNVAQQNLNGNSLNNIFDVGANYVNSFGDFDVAVSGRWGIASNDVAGADDPEVWGAGINLGFAGVTVGGSFAEQNGSGADDGTVYDAGISYETGPWGFSFTYMHGENVDDENVATGSDEQLDQYLLGISYKLAKGVSLNGFGAYVDFQEDAGDGGVGTQGNDVDGFVVGTGIKISF
ncbi:MAG: porin [Paracoccaceae bacterium]